MTTPQPSHLNQNSFKKMLAGAHGYLPEKVSKTLKKLGLGSLLQQQQVSKDQALRALNALKQEGMAPRPIAPSATYAAAAKQQSVEDQAIADAKRLKFARAAIRYDVAKERDLHDQVGQTVLEEQRQLTNNRQHQGEITRINREKSRRDQSKNQLHPAKGINPQRPTLMEPPDLAIG
jgi:hypothetical protein